MLGIENVPQAQALRISDVRYYHQTDRAEAEKIVLAVKNAGEPNVNLNPQHEKSAAVRPNTFEVWLAHRAE